MSGLFQSCPQVRSIRQILGDHTPAGRKLKAVTAPQWPPSPNFGPGSHATAVPQLLLGQSCSHSREAFLTCSGRGWSSQKPWCYLVSTAVRYAVGEAWRVMVELIREPGTFVPWKDVRDESYTSPQTPTQEGNGRWTSNARWSLFSHQQQHCHLHAAQQNITNKEVASLHVVTYVC